MKAKRGLALGLALFFAIQGAGQATAAAGPCSGEDAAAFWQLIEDRPQASSYLIDFEGDGRSELLLIWPSGGGAVSYQVYGALGQKLAGIENLGYAWTLVSRAGRQYLARSYEQDWNTVTEYCTVENGQWVMTDYLWAELDRADRSYVAYKVGGTDTTEDIYNWAVGSYREEAKLAGFDWVAGHSDVEALEAGGAASRPSDWASAEVGQAAASGVTIYRDGHSYQSPATRLQLAEGVMRAVVKVAGWPEDPARSPFRDTSDYWVLTAHSLGIVNGTSATTFNPEGRVTREEMATMLYRAIRYLEQVTGKTVLTQAGDLSGYADAGQVSAWAAEGLGALVANGVVKGTSDTALSPKDRCTLEQAQMLCLRVAERFQ